eukprot:7508763-Lingulodinium_polyedra.AAC.1
MPGCHVEPDAGGLLEAQDHCDNADNPPNARRLVGDTTGLAASETLAHLVGGHRRWHHAPGNETATVQLV